MKSLYVFVNWLYTFQTIICLKHVQPVNEKIKTIHKNSCISLVYIHNVYSSVSSLELTELLLYYHDATSEMAQYLRRTDTPNRKLALLQL